MTPRDAIACAALLVLLPATAREAAAQDAPTVVIVQLRGDIARDVAQAIDEPLREMARDLRDSMHALTSDPGVARRGRQAKSTSHADIVDRQTRPLTLGPSGALDLNTLGGTITVTAGSGSPTLEIVRRVRARTDADAQRALARTSVVVEDRAGRVRARTVDAVGDGQSTANVEVSFVATVPVGTGLYLATIGGDIVVTGVRGDINAHTTVGNITFTDIGSVGVARTVAGSITITDAQGDGDASIHAMSGEVTITRVKARQLNVDTVMGNITAADVTAHQASMNTTFGRLAYRGAMARDGHYDFHSHSGAIHFEPTGPVGFELDAHSYSGGIDIDPVLQVRANTPGRRALTGTSGDGQAVVVISTFSGNVTIGAIGKK